MCGIVGLIARHQSGFGHKQVELFTDLLRMDSIRGPDSTGAFGVSIKGKIDIIKGNTDGHTFVSSSNWDEFKKRIFSDHKIIIGHNRKATKGSITAHNAHPFKEKHITLVHNGIIYNSDNLKKEVEVDSHAVAHALSEHNALDAIGKISGAFAFVWFDEKDQTLALVRNKERPLFLLKYADCWIISSEFGLPTWLQGRNQEKPESHLLLDTDKIYVFKLKDLQAGYEEIPYEEYSNYKPYIAPLQKQQEYIPQVKQRGSINVFEMSDLERITKNGYKTGDKSCL